MHVPWQLLRNQQYHMLIDYIHIVSFHEKEVLALVVQGNLLAFINQVRIDYNIALPCLSEYLIENNCCKSPTLHKVFQHLSRSYRWQLVTISHHNQPCSRCNGF